MLASKTDIKKAQSTANKMLELIVPVGGGFAGFAAGDFLGLSDIIGQVVDSVLALIPQLSLLSIAPLVAGGLLIGAGLMLSSVKFSDFYMSLIPSAIGWFLVGAGAREILDGLTTSVAEMKANANVGQVGQ